IIQAMVGRDLSDRFPKRPPKNEFVPGSALPQDGTDFAKRTPSENFALEVRNWTVEHPLYEGRKVCDNINMYMRKGEVVGISGLMGAGRTEFAMSVFGKSYGVNIKGELLKDGKRITLNSVQEAIDAKIAYVTEDRKGNGLVLGNPISTNTTLANMNAVSRNQVIDADKEINIAEKYRKDLRTKSSSVYQNVGSLSGGNQQKVLLAKWMFTDPDVLILDEPTRGIDVGAKYDIYTIINELVAQGKSVLMISSELPEILGMCDRIYVMNEGRIVAEMPGKEATQESIMAAIVASGKE
ncbi:MAG: ATP-binding cassette domain-containing protein, partial [Spirochaetaceae bacterium]|nr:ATP-binding cassette domain-containing protein [Spirochaetaceae bacterium]